MISYTKKKYFVLVMCFCIYLKTNAINYYFSSSNGNDSYTASHAQNPLTPWQTITKLNTIMNTLVPGDSVLFKCGDTFYGTITVPVSGNLLQKISFSSFGIGPLPIITGLDPLTNWTNIGPNLWQSNCPTCNYDPNLFLINGKRFAAGRYPNLNTTNGGFKTLNSASSNSLITDNTLTNSPNWTGAEIVIKKNRWTVDRGKIINHSGNSINYSGTSSYVPIVGFGYFIQNHIQTLDLDNEWCYNMNTKTFTLFSATNPNAKTIETKTINKLLNIKNQNNLSFSNISFVGADTLAKIYYCNGVSINNCTFSNSASKAIVSVNCKNVILNKCSINNSNCSAITFINNCQNISITNNTLNNIGTILGSSNNGFSAAFGIQAEGKNIGILNNRIDSVGFSGIRFVGDSIQIKNNYINTFNLIKEDGGGINNGIGNTGILQVYDNIVDNIITNGIGAPYGTTDTITRLTEGIYLDDNSHKVTLSGNTIANMPNCGIKIHNAFDLTLLKNTVFDCKNAIGYLHDAIVTNDSIHNCITKNNIFFSPKTINDIMLISLQSPNTITNKIASLGLLDSNYYCRPFNEVQTIHAGSSGNWQYYNLPQWQLAYPIFDNNSKITPIQYSTYMLNNLVGNNKFSNQTFSANITNVSCWSPSVNCVTSWDNSGVLDGGCLKYSFSPVLNNTITSVITLPIGYIDSLKKYIVRFSLKGCKNNKLIEINLRKAAAPYTNLCAFQSCNILTTRTENEFLFTPTKSDNNAILQIRIEEGDSTLWFDNIEIYEANTSSVNPNNVIRFEYNDSQTSKTIPLTDQYIDVKNNFYANSLTLQPFTSVILLKVPNPLGVINNLTDQKSSITIYPNPTTNQLNFQSENKNLSKILVYDLVGRHILEQNYGEQLDVTNLNNGIYIIKIINKNSECVGSHKIIIQK